MLSSVFPLFGKGSSLIQNGRESDLKDPGSTPSLRVNTDREAYRPGDTLVVTIEVHNAKCSIEGNANGDEVVDCGPALQIDDLVVELKGVQKLDPQWIIMPKPVPGSRERRGECTILDSTPTSIASNVMLKQGNTISYLVCATLPNTLPPTFKGSAVRYLYYILVILRGKHVTMKYEEDFNYLAPIRLDSRILLNIWSLPNNANVVAEEVQGKIHVTDNGLENVWPQPIEILYKERESSMGWIRANEVNNADDEHPASFYRQESIDISFERSLMLQSPAATPRNSVFVERPGFGSFRKASPLIPPVSKTACNAETENGRQLELSDMEVLSEASTSDAFVRGRSYNIRLDDQILVRFSPKNSDATYYFGDMIGGVLTFFHDTGPRRCLEVSITLENLESVNANVIHPSRRQSPIITKVQSEYHEVVADLLQTHFMFNIPLEGPMSFVSPHVSLQWVLRFEFITSSKHVNWSKYEHPLMVEGREKGEWVLPITVFPPVPRAHVSFTRKEKRYSPNGFWIGSMRSDENNQNHSFLSGWENANGVDGSSNFSG